MALTFDLWPLASDLWPLTSTLWPPTSDLWLWLVTLTCDFDFDLWLVTCDLWLWLVTLTLTCDFDDLRLCFCLWPLTFKADGTLRADVTFEWPLRAYGPWSQSLGSSISGLWPLPSNLWPLPSDLRPLTCDLWLWLVTCDLWSLILVHTHDDAPNGPWSQRSWILGLWSLTSTLTSDLWSRKYGNAF